MKNILTVDVEEWFHPEAVQNQFPPEKWTDQESRVEKNVDTLIELFRQHNTHATFFILGWVAEKNPAMVKRISDAGHEIASHGYSHRMITKMNEVEFQNDLKKSLDTLKSITGKNIRGYRAPTFSLVKSTQWAWQIMEENGLIYDSSVYPVYHDRYGIPDAPRQYYLPLKKPGTLIEFPMSTLQFFGKNLPFGGGGYLRIFPLWFTKWAVKKINREKIPAILYMHPWEFDPGQPVVNSMSTVSRWRHYYNIDSNLKKLNDLLSDFKWGSFEEFMKENELI